MLRIYYTIFESISHEEEKVDEFNGFKRFNRFTGKVRRKNKEAPRSFDSISRRRHLERSREILLAGRSAC